MRIVLIVLALLLGCDTSEPSSTTTPAADVQLSAMQGVPTVELCGPDEPGEKIVFGGRVLDYAGQPLSRAAVVAYNADTNGLYARPGATTRTPRLRGVAVTDDQGRFRFSTVRPGGYPSADDPAHIHLTVTSAGHRLRYVTYWFEGDPRITDAKRREASSSREIVIVELHRDNSGRLSFGHEIQLEGD